MPEILSRLPAPLKEGVRAAALFTLRARERLLGEDTGIVLVLAHMRSGSTLLTHILLSHPDILGCGERNAVYSSSRDLERLKLDARYRRREYLRRYRYVADQVNHTRFLTNQEVLNDPRVRKIFLVRAPEPSLASMVDVLGHYYGTTLEEAASYYAERLAALADHAEQLRDPETALFLTYDDLVGRTQDTLGALADFLGLAEPLSERYRRFDFTGRRGDPAEHIHAGRVLRAKPPRRVPLPAGLLAEARQRYDDCVATLAARCRAIDEGGSSRHA